MNEARRIRTLKDTNYFAPGTYKNDFKQHIINIGFATIITKTVLAPLERWRIIKQTQIAYPLRPLVFSSFLNYLSRIPKEQGITAFWRGNLAGIWLYLTQSLIQVGFYDNLKSLQSELVFQSQQNSIYRIFCQRLMIPIISTFFTQCITYPIDTARVRITMNYAKQKKNYPFKGIRTCLKQLRFEENFSAIYKGFILSNAISLINFNLYLVFASLTVQINLGTQTKNYINSDTLAAVGALLLIHPLDTLKKIIQLNNLSNPVIFKNTRSALAWIQKQVSINNLWSGMLVSALKSLMFLPTFYLVQKGLQESKRQINF